MKFGISRVKRSVAGPRCGLLCVIALLGALFLAADLARADGIPISGTASFVNAVSFDFSFSGPGVSVFSTTPQAPGSTFFTCNLNSVCDVTLTLPTCLAQGFGSVDCLAETTANLGGASADVLGGSLTFSGSVFIPSTAPGTNVNFNNIPVTLQGTVIGYDVLNCPANCILSRVWALGISGTGTLDLSGTTVYTGGFNEFGRADYSFTGTTTPTPEPTSLLLLGTGLTAIGFLKRRRKSRSRAARRPQFDTISIAI
jgi:hypothetical protein